MIEMVRLDYRLLHGQVVFSWVRNIGVSRIIIVDDAAAEDQFQNMVIRLSKPSGVKLDIITVEEMIQKSKTISKLKEKTMIIVGNTSTALELVKNISEIRKINYGCIENKEGSKQYSNAIFLNESEMKDTKDILSLGVEIYIQQVPTDKSKFLKEVI